MPKDADLRRAESLRMQIVEDVLNLRCPHCKTVFEDFSGCFNLTCSRSYCGAQFCAHCLIDYGVASYTCPLFIIVHCLGTFGLIEQEDHIMPKKNIPLSALYLAILSVLSANQSFAQNFIITPAPGYAMPTTVYPGETVSAYYTITNQTNTTRRGYVLQGHPRTVTQNASSKSYCPTPITLIGHAHCIMQLDITGEAKSNFAICNGTSCSTAAVPLNITQLAILPNTTVGYYRNTNGSFAPLSYTSINGGISWTVSAAPLPLPADVNTTPDNQDSELISSTCDSAGHCSAVGAYTNTNGGIGPLSYTSSNRGASWTVNAAPLPLPADAYISFAFLVSNTCYSADLCNAVGFYLNVVDNVVGFAPLSYTSINGGISWTVSAAPLPLPTDVNTTLADQNSQLNSSTCDTAGHCSAVGVYTNTSGGKAPLSYTSSNSGISWTVSAAPLPLPANVNATPDNQDSELRKVS